MKKIDAQALKSKHRIELVMQEFGEVFHVQGDQWISTTSPGVSVNVQLQTYEHQRPGIDKQAGDLFDWLQLRFGWTFQQAIRYLQKRDVDPEPIRNEQIPEPEENTIAPLAKHEWKFESASPDKEKEASGLYDYGLVDSGDGKPFYQYLLKPIDQWQERALEIGSEKIRECFTWETWEIYSMLHAQPSRFIPVMDMDVEWCDECGDKLDWWWKKKPQYEFGEVRPSGFSKKRVYDSRQVYAFEYELYEETFCVCEKCMRAKINYRHALSLLYKSARHRNEATCLMQKEGAV